MRGVLVAAALAVLTAACTAVPPSSKAPNPIPAPIPPGGAPTTLTAIARPDGATDRVHGEWYWAPAPDVIRHVTITRAPTALDHTSISISESARAKKINYTAVLNVAFLVLAAFLVWRFLRTGGPGMLAMMDMAPDEMSGMGA